MMDIENSQINNKETQKNTQDVIVKEDHAIDTQDVTQDLTIDTTTGDLYLTQKNLQDVVELINKKAGNEELKATIQTQKLALDSLQQEFNKQLDSKNQKIQELEKEIKELLLQQPTDTNTTIGNTLIDLRQQVHNLSVNVSDYKKAFEIQHENLQTQTQTKDTDLQTQISDIVNRIDNFTDEFSVDSLTKEILKEPAKAQQVIVEILKNPYSFPPFQLNPTIDNNADVFSQVRETLNTSREILRLLGTLDYINKHFQDDATQLKVLIQKALNDLLVTRDESLKNLEKVSIELDKELQNVKYILDILSKEQASFKLLRDETAWYHSEAFASYSLCKDYANFCVNLKNDCITIRDDISALNLVTESIKEEARGFKDRTEFLWQSLINMNYDGLVAKVNHLEYMINTMSERKREEIIQAIDTLGKFLLGSLKDVYNDYKSFLNSQFINSKVELRKLCDDIIELIDDKKLETLDQINILTLSSLGALQSAKQLSLDLIRFNTDECLEELTQHKSDYLVELQDMRVDSINTIHEHFAVSGKGFMHELARINNELNALKHNTFMPEANYTTLRITETQVFTTPNDGLHRNYFILLKGGSGYDNHTTRAGEPSSFGEYKTVQGGLPSGNGRGTDGESSFFVIALGPNVEINVTIGEGRTKGFCEISYAISENANTTTEASVENNDANT